MTELTPTQTRGLATIERLLKKGYPPRLCEIQSAMGYKSVSAVQNILRGLHSAGAITWEPRKARSIRIVGQDSKKLEFNWANYQNCTKIEIQILQAIAALTNQHQRAPSNRDLLAATGILGTQTLLNHLNKLRCKRAVTWSAGKARTLRVLPRPDCRS